MGTRPENHSLDRINNEGNYEPSNCKWSTRNEQNSNTRTNSKNIGVTFISNRGYYRSRLVVNKIVYQKFFKISNSLTFLIQC